MNESKLYSKHEWILERFGKLLTLDRDAVLSLAQAIKNIDDDEIRGLLGFFKKQNERHIIDLLGLALDHGGNLKPLLDDHSQSLLYSGITYPVDGVGTLGALLTLAACKAVTCTRYRKTYTCDLNLKERIIVDRNGSEEQFQLVCLTDLIERKLGLV